VLLQNYKPNKMEQPVKVETFGKLAPKVVDEIIDGLCEMYIYDNSKQEKRDEKKWKKAKVN
jgi:hypothetical protein